MHHLSSFFLALAITANAYAIDNSIRVTEKAGVSSANYPLQIGRPFVPGDIANFPQAVVDGVPVLTQADVKARWRNGSVKHAILTFLIPQLKANATSVISFRNQTVGNNDGYLTTSAMLDPKYNFDAEMDLSNGSTKTVSARSMMPAATYWLQGAVATSVVLADHSSYRAYDVGFDSNRSIRPIFHVTFWPGVNKIHVRFIGEIANTESLQDQVYALVLKTGLAPVTTVYSKPQFTHTAMSRWTKDFWIGGAPTTISIDHNLAYLAQTRFVYTYDLTKTISESTLASEYSLWQSQAKDLYDAGGWQKLMGTAGGRPDIGPYPDWATRWLYTGDYRMLQQTQGNADLSAAWPIHLREGRAGKNLQRTDPANAGTGVGHVISISNRPTFRMSALTYSYTLPADAVLPVGTVTSGGWSPDAAHSPDIWSPLYTLTGDFWYLEELWYWSSWEAAQGNGAAYSYYYGRGPTGAEGGLDEGEIRAEAWTLRTRVNTTFVSPDASPEKSYYRVLINDAIAIEEGARNMINSPFYGNDNWNWGNAKRQNPLGVPPLNQWRQGDSSFAQADYGLDTTVTGQAISQFEQNFMMFALGRAKQLGFPAGNLSSYLAKSLIGVLTDPGYNPYLLANGRIPTVRLSDGKYFVTYADMKKGYSAVWQNTASFPLDDAVHGYDFIGLAATSMISAEPGGAAAWSFMQTHVLNAPILTNNPKWAILPAVGPVLQ